MTLLVTRKTVSEMTYNVSSGTLNSTIPYHTSPWPLYTSDSLLHLQRPCWRRQTQPPPPFCRHRRRRPWLVGVPPPPAENTRCAAADCIKPANTSNTWSIKPIGLVSRDPGKQHGTRVSKYPGIKIPNSMLYVENGPKGNYACISLDLSTSMSSTRILNGTFMTVCAITGTNP